jgi:hypothetical protein
MGNTAIEQVSPEFDAGYYKKITGYSYNEFISECKEIDRDYIKFDVLLNKYTIMLGFNRIMFREAFINGYIAIHSRQIIL